MYLKTSIKFISLHKQIENLSKALTKAEQHKSLDDLEYFQESCIQRFEYCTESSRKTLKTLLHEKYGIETIGPKDTIKQSFEAKLIDDLDLWFALISDRNESSHNYDEETVQEIFADILGSYIQAFELLLVTISHELSQ